MLFNLISDLHINDEDQREFKLYFESKLKFFFSPRKFTEEIGSKEKIFSIIKATFSKLCEIGIMNQKYFDYFI